MASTALITGASRGLGLALARALAARHWRLVIDARGADALEAARRELAAHTDVTALVGDVADERHRRALVTAAGDRIDALVNNASILGPSPQPALDAYPLDVLEDVLKVNALAPLRLIQLALPAMPDGARIVNVTSDAAVEAYEGWGGYGSSKAALEQLTQVLARRAPEARRLRLRSGRHEHRAAPGGVPGRGHLRSPAARGQRARAAVAARRRPAQRALPRRRHQGRHLSAQPAFELPERLEAHAPPEARGLARDDVRMLVARGDGRLVHARARELADFLRPGDLVVINTSATLPAALAARRTDGTALELRLSTPLPGAAEDRWVVELRAGAEPFRGGRAGDVLDLAGGGRATLEAPYLTGARLWAARLELPEPLLAYLARHGAPIRYRYVPDAHPLSAYETAYATEPGSAEMPSAGRPVTPARRSPRWRRAA